MCTSCMDIYPREMNACVYMKTYTWVFIETLFVITKNWKQPACPSTGK